MLFPPQISTEKEAQNARDLVACTLFSLEEKGELLRMLRHVLSVSPPPHKKKKKIETTFITTHQFVISPFPVCGLFPSSVIAPLSRTVPT